MYHAAYVKEFDLVSLIIVCHFTSQFFKEESELYGSQQCTVYHLIDSSYFIPQLYVAMAKWRERVRKKNQVHWSM